MRRIILTFILCTLTLVGNASASSVMEKLNITRHTPQLKTYHMQTAAERYLERRGGEGGQVVMALAMSNVNPELMLMGTDTSQLWRSVDGGENWDSVPGINMWAVADIAFHPTQENTVYIIQSISDIGALGLAKLENSSKDGLYKSTDGGITFTHVLHKRFLVSNLSEGLIKFDSKGSVYALSSEGIFKSENGEDAWENLGLELTQDKGVFCLDVSPDGETIIAATQAAGLMASFDSGANWASKNGNMENPVAGSIAVNPVDGTNWFATFYDAYKGLYKSNDSGETWVPMDYEYYDQKNTPAFVKFGPIDAQGMVKLYLIYDIMAVPFKCSIDFGETWISPVFPDKADIVTYHATGYQAEGLCIDSQNPNVVYYSFGDIIYKSTDGGITFYYKSSGFSGNYAQKFIFDNEGRILFPFTDKGLAITDYAYKQGAYPTVRMLKTGGTSTDAAINPNNDSHIITSIGSWTLQRLHESFDGGETWSIIEELPEADHGQIEFHKTKSNIIYTTSYTSFDSGENWLENNIAIQAISPVDNDIVYGVSRSQSNVLVVSEDCGITWQEVGGMASTIVKITPDRFQNDVVWVGGYSGIIVKFQRKTATQAMNMTAMDENNGLPPRNKMCIGAIAQNPKNPKHLLIGGKDTVSGETSPGLYETLDGGVSWKVIEGMPSSKMIFEIEFSQNTSEAFLATYSGTIIYEYGERKHVYRIDEDTLRPYYELFSSFDANTNTTTISTNTTQINRSINHNTTDGSKTSLYYCFDLSDYEYIESAYITLTNQKINSGGVFSLYEITDDQWRGSSFGEATIIPGASINLEEGATVSLQGGFICNSQTFSYNESITTVSMDVSQEVKEAVENGKASIKFWLQYNSAELRSTDGARVYSNSCGIDEYRPKLVVAHGEITDVFDSEKLIARIANNHSDALAIFGVYNGDRLVACTIGSEVRTGIYENAISTKGIGKEHFVKSFLMEANTLRPLVQSEIIIWRNIDE